MSGYSYHFRPSGSGGDFNFSWVHPPLLTSSTLNFPIYSSQPSAAFPPPQPLNPNFPLNSFPANHYAPSSSSNFYPTPSPTSNFPLQNPNPSPFPAESPNRPNPGLRAPARPFPEDPREVLQKIDAAVEKIRAELVGAGRYVSAWKVLQSALLSLNVDAETCLGLQVEQVLSLQRLMATEGRINAFIHCFVGVRKITSLYNLEVAICKNEDRVV